jgi:tetratricopeptide (TPR) repeat protein
VSAPGSQRPTQPASNGTDESFDLKAQLSELERVVRESQHPPAPGQKKKTTISVDKVFERFKTRVRGQVSDHDSSTHYDLGVAYKEMKLFGDAIEELKLAARDPSLECNCYSMVGLIYAEQEKWEEAGKAYTRALSSVKKTVAQEGNLYYDLGHVHEKLGLFEQASYYFQQVLRRDSSFRDTRERVATLRQRAQNVTKTSASGDEELDRAFEELLGD